MESGINGKAVHDFFDQNKDAYCLVTESDFISFNLSSRDDFEIAATDYIFRKRMNIDQGFLKGLLNLKSDVVRYYMMEK